MTDHQQPAAGGLVLRPGDPGYDEEISGYNQIVTHRPRIVVAAQGPHDVVAAVKYAAAHGLTVGVQATGHGVSVPADGVLISTRRMTTVEVDPPSRTARVEAGTVSRDLLAAAAEHGLAPLGGSSPGVGVVGYTLGGGVPLLGRQHGYAADQVRSLDVVTADGVLRRATANHEPDLFWALLGGRGNFGVVTSLETRLVPVATVTGGGLWFTGAHIAPAVHAYARWASCAPDTMGSSVMMMRLPDSPNIQAPLRGRHVAHIRILHSGPPDEATALVQELRNAAPPAQDTIMEMPYGEVGTLHHEPAGPVRFEASNTLLSRLDGEAVDTLLAHAGPAGTGPYLVELRHLGGRLSSTEDRQGAIGRRDGQFVLYAGTALEGLDRTVAAEAQDRLHQAMAPWGTGGVCPSFLSGPGVGTDRYRAGFDPDTFDRLQRIKAAVDPANMFRINNNVPPLAGSGD